MHWIHHGEDDGSSDDATNIDHEESNINIQVEDELDETVGILHDLCNATTVNDMGDNSSEDMFGDPGSFPRLFMEVDQELYVGCAKVSKLYFVIKLLHLKLLNGWSNKTFDMLLEFLKEILPSDAHVPKSYYESKKIIRDLGMKYNKIDACKNDCVLFWNDLKDVEHCPICGLSKFYFNDRKG